MSSEVKAKRLMPDAFNLGKSITSTIGHAMMYLKSDEFSHLPGRKVMGFRLPEWQRGLVWTEEQDIRLIESIWKGIPIGTYSYVQNDDVKTDGLLIDGQQRLYAIECYLKDEFPVLGYYWSELTPVDRRVFSVSRSFPCYIVESSDEEFLRGYYDLMNFGGTAHDPGQRASRDATSSARNDDALDDGHNEAPSFRP